MLEKNKKKILDILVKLKLIEKVENKDAKKLNTKHYIVAFIVTMFLKDIIYSIGNFNFDNSRYGTILIMMIYLPIIFIFERIFLKNKKKE